VHRTTLFLILQVWIIIGLIVTAEEAKEPLAKGGWLVNPGTSLTWRGVSQLGKRKRCRVAPKRGWYTRHRASTWHLALARSLLLWGLWQVSGQVGPDWLLLLPWVIWVLPAEGKLRRVLWEVERLVIFSYLLFILVNWARRFSWGEATPQYWGIGGVLTVCEEPYVYVERQEGGGYCAHLKGEFSIRVENTHPFRVRLLILFLGFLDVEGHSRKSRRTRDGRTPFVRQEQLASWFGVSQEEISRWGRYWLDGDWANLLSLKTAEVLTHELVEGIVKVCATFPTWSGTQIYGYLRQQGQPVSQAQVDQARKRSGWEKLQAVLQERFDLEGGFRLRDEWVVQELLAQVRLLLGKLETGRGLTPEERISLNDVQVLAKEADVQPAPSLPVQPWLQGVERVLFGQWETLNLDTLHCPYCGSSDVAPKSKQPRRKKYYDAEGKLQQIEVYRYYCHNPQCPHQSFTHLPAGLVPYSPYRTQMHVLALQMYAWGYSTYRRTGTALGLHAMTVWRWVSAWGHDLLPIAALFGVVKSSGVVGTDEKYVLVPKNDKPQDEMRRWMYVYLAVDLWTYDLLHIAIYPYNNEASAQAFLLALRAKGYHPQVIVTDLRQDYGPLIALVFPSATHHECIFHALQNVQKHIQDVYGRDYAQQFPQAEQLKQAIYDIFDTHSSAEAHLRYQAVLELKNAYLQDTPSAALIFSFLQRHWPKLVNAIGSDTIPTTNNVTEEVIRRFDQHYQNFCGFDSIETARIYLGVFEKIYRFTPFSQDAQPRVRGKSPLQLAGYDIAQFPMWAICSGLSIGWPTEVNLVPN
jgi:hypothetical protein